MKYSTFAIVLLGALAPCWVQAVETPTYLQEHPVDSPSARKLGKKMGKKEGKKDDNFRRELGKLDRPTSRRALEIIEERGADADGIFMHRDNLIPKEVCDKVKTFIDKSHADELDDLMESKELDARTNENRFEIYNTFISGSKLVELIGKDHAKTLLDFMHDSAGWAAPVTDIKVQVTNNFEKEQHFSYHLDHQISLIVFLAHMEGEDEDSSVGSLTYLLRDGAHDVEPRPGTVAIHGPNVLHGANGWTGKRYVIDIMSTDEEAECILKKHVE